MINLGSKLVIFVWIVTFNILLYLSLTYVITRRRALGRLKVNNKLDALEGESNELPPNTFIYRLFHKQGDKKRMAKFSAQLVDVVSSLSTSIKAGYNLTQAINIISEEFEWPASVEFKQISLDIDSGKSYEEAIENFMKRNRSADVEVLATAFIINKETGGNLTHLLDSISESIREREKLEGEVKSLTAQGRLSGMILLMLPIFVLLIMFLLNPGYVKPFIASEIGRLMMAVGIVGQIIGGIVIAKITKIDW